MPELPPPLDDEALNLARAQRLEALGALAGGLAHGFDNVLAVISGYIDMALEADLPDGPREHLQTARRAAERAAGLSRQVTAFGRQDPQPVRPLRLRPLVEDALRFLRACLPASIRIEQYLAADPLVLADPAEVNRRIVLEGVRAGRALDGRAGLLSVSLQVDGDQASLLEFFPISPKFSRRPLPNTTRLLIPKIEGLQ